MTDRILTLRDGDVLEQENDGSDWEFASQSRYEIRIDVRGTNVLEARGNGLQNFNGVFARLALAVAAVKPRRDGENNDHEGIAEG